MKISNKDFKTIKHCRKSFLFHDNKLWIKNNNQLFDVTMGSYNGAKICELVIILILSQLSKIRQRKHRIIQRWQPCHHKRTKQFQTRQIQEKITNALKLLGFKITIKTNLKINFQDVKLNLEKGTFKHFKKENDTPIYIHTYSNHSPSIIKQIPISINRRLSDNSSNINIFNSKKYIYNNAVKK